MVDLAQHGAAGPVLRRDIAERQEVSADYVAQLFVLLQSAGLVDGVKGPGGGYRLARDAGSISAGDVVRAVEGPIALVHCIESSPGEGPPCKRIDRCVTHPLWKKLSDTVSQALDSVTLRELADQGQRLVAEAE